MAIYYMDLEEAALAIEKIHNMVDPSDEFERKLFEETFEVANLIIDAYSAAQIPKQEMIKDVLPLLNNYFKAEEEHGFKYK